MTDKHVNLYATVLAYMRTPNNGFRGIEASISLLSGKMMSICTSLATWQTYHMEFRWWHERV